MKKSVLLSGLSLVLMFTLWSFSKEDAVDRGIVTIYYEDYMDRIVINTKRITIIDADGFSETQEISVTRKENEFKGELILNARLNTFYKRGYKLVGQSQSYQNDVGRLFCYTLQK